MKNIKLLYILMILPFLYNINVYASACSYQEQITLNNDMSNIKITYEINNNEINILIYNLTENLFIEYEHPDIEESKIISYYDTTNGKYIITRNNSEVENYSFEIKSNLSSCYGNILTTKKIIKPKYNEYSKLEICNNKALYNHTYCQEYITTNINKTQTEVEKTLKEFLNNKVGIVTTQAVVIDKKTTIKQIIIYSSIIVAIGIIVTTGIIIYKKRSEL